MWCFSRYLINVSTLASENFGLRVDIPGANIYEEGDFGLNLEWHENLLVVCYCFK